MPSGKARFTGVTDEPIEDFSQEFEMDFESFFKDKIALGDPVDKGGRPHPRHELVKVILAEVGAVLSLYSDQHESLTKEDICAEVNNLHKRLFTISTDLRRVSPDVDRLLDADPLDCVDSIDIMVASLERAQLELYDLIAKLRTREIDHKIAVELAIRVLRVAKDYGFSVSATADLVHDSSSNAVKLLKLIGNQVQIVMSEVTWRYIIIKARQQVPDLQ